MAKTLEQIFNDSAYDITATKKSQQWFTSQVKKLANVTTPQNLVNSGTLTNTLVPGSMYLFFYDPKTKDTLPYFDRFPLVLPYEKTPDGFMGLNFHYLPPILRVRLLDRLMMFKTSKELTERTRIKFTYAVLNNASKFALAKPCIKRYITSHVRSKFSLISSEEWVTAMLLPVERFVGATKEQVWRDSKRNAI
jgi:hypothetical protein